MKNRLPFPARILAACMMLQPVFAATLPADVLFREDFENPDVPSYSEVITPDIWVRAAAGYGSGSHGMTDKSGGDFTAPSGNEQAYAFRYSNSGITTKEQALGSPLVFGGGYEVSFNVVKDNATAGRGYSVQLIAFGSGAARNDCRSTPTGSTVLASSSGNAPSDGSMGTVTFTFIPNATTHAAEFGKDLGIRFLGSLSSAIIDNIQFRAIPGTSAGLNLVTTSPLDNSGNNLASLPAKAIFNKNIAAGTGNITLRNLTDNIDTVIPVGDPRISISGTCLNIEAGAPYTWGKNYAIRIDPGAVVETSPGAGTFAGIADDTTWNFTMAGGDPLLYSISRLKDHITGTITLTAAEIDTIKRNLDTVAGRFAESSTTITALLDLINTYDTGTVAGRKGPLWVNQSLPKRDVVTNDLHWTMFNVMQNVMDRIYTKQTLASHEGLLNGFKFRSSSNFPGNCTTPSPANVYTSTISASYLKTYGPPIIQDGPGTYARKPTGCYLAPGTIATVTVPASMVNTGYKIRVGCHSWDFSAKPDIKRLDRVTRVYDITSSQTTVANPLGGGIYIEVPWLANAGVVNVDITGAARSPYFSAKTFHTTTATQWDTVERSNPGPWADFQTDKFMMQVPKSWVSSMTGAQAATLMADWDKAMDAINDLMGYTTFNPATGPEKYIRGKETMYPQVDLLLKNSVYAPGYPSVNTTYSPTTAYNGYVTSHLVRGPQNAPDYEFHEQGHGYLFPKFGGETESAVNLLHVAVMNRKFGKTMDDAFRGSRGYTRTYMTLDTTAMAWMCVFNFSPRKVPMADGEKAYQLKGHAKFVDIANLYGWDVLGKFWGTMVDMDDKGIAYATDNDSMLFRLCQAVGKDIRPLFHFWGIYPANSSALAAQIAAANIPADPAIKNRLLYYKTLVPADNAAFRSFATSWWGKQPSINGYWEEREHSRQWDQTALFGPGDQQRADITINEEYIPACANQIRDRVQELVDLYFPNSIAPSAMSFAVAPAAANATTIGMTATTATSATPPIQYYFENTTNNTNSGWISTTSWNQTSLTTGQSYAYRVKARDGLLNETAWSLTASATAQADATPPSPSPMTFAAAPAATGLDSITMTAGTASDINGVEYFFDCLTPGGHDSGWQDSPNYTDTGLSQSTEYTYQVQARDKSAAQNATAFSTPASATTPTPDTTPPSVLSLSPADNAQDVPLDAGISITFNELVGPNTGFVTVKNLTDATESVIDINDDTQIAISGSELTIGPTAGILPRKNYAIRIDATAVQDLSGNPFAGIADDTTWNFTTAVVPYVWAKTTGGAQSWNTAANWQGGAVPSPVAGDTVDFSSANITAATTLTLEADRTSQLWKFGDATTASHDWTVNAGNSMILAGATPTIEVVNRTATLNNVVAGSAGLTKTGAGTLALAGANTYTGGTNINGGILSVNASAASAVAGGPLSLDSGGRLTLSSTVSSFSQVSVGSGGGQISVTGNNSFTTTGKLTGTGVLTHVDPGGSGNRSLNFNATNNDFTGGIIINGGNALTFAANSLADSANNIAFTAASGTNGFTYGSGATSALKLDNRAFEINSAGALNSTILNNSATYAITIKPNLVATGAGAKTLTLNAVSGPTNVFAGNITNGTGGGTVALTRSGTGTWALSGSNTYSGATQVSASNCKLVIQGKQALSPNTTVTLFQNSSSHGDLWILDDTAGTVSLPNTLTIDHKNSVLNLVVFVGNNGTANGGANPAATNTGSTIALGKLNFTDLNNGQGLVGFNASGANGYRLQFNQVDLPPFTTTFTSLATWTARLIPGSANVTIAGTVRQLAGNSCTFGTQPVFSLDGTSSNNIVSGDIKDPADLGTNTLAKALQVTKTNSSVWTLSGNNTFSGGLTLSGASANSQLNINSATALGTGTFTISGGNNAKIDNTSGVPVALASNNAQTWNNDFAFVGSNSLDMGNGAVTMGGTRAVTVTAGTLSVGGAISGNTFGLTKAGNGTLVLGGANAYTGNTTVSAGKLFINGDQTAATGTLTVNANATLGGTGIIGGTTTIAANGRLEFNLSTSASNHDKLELATGKALIFSGASTLTLTATAGAVPGDFTLVTAPGGFGTSAPPATVILPSGWTAGAPRFVGNDLKINITSTGAATAPEIAVEQPSATDIPNNGSKDFGTVTVGSNSSLQFTIRNTGTGDLNLTGSPLVAVSGTHAADFTVTATPTTPVSSGGGTTTFTVRFTPGAAGARAAVLTIANNDSDESGFTINLGGTGQSPYDAWAGGAAFDADTNGDGITNGLAWLLGAADKNAGATALVPVAGSGNGNLVMTFTCLKTAKRGTAALKLQFSGDLGVSDAWTSHETAVPDATTTTANGVVFTASANNNPDLVNIRAEIPANSGARIFGRLVAVGP